jgi:hypothetical protein
MNSAAVNTSAGISPAYSSPASPFPSLPLSLFSSTYPVVELLDHMAILCLVFIF